MKIFKKINWPLILGAIVIFELLSFLAFFFYELNYILLILVFLLTIVLAWRSLESAILLLLVELIISSHGHLFSIDILSFSLSIRMSIWLAIMLVFFIKLFVKKQWFKLLFKQIPFLKYYLLLALFVIIALINGIILGNNLSYLFTDFNSWLFFLLIFPIAFVYFSKNDDKEKLSRLKSIFFLAVFWLSLKTWFLIIFFSYDLAILPDLYTWLRDARVAEITSMPDAWPRIFLQSHIFSAIAFLLLVFKRDFASKFNASELILAGFFLSTVIISFSRSFWLAIALVFLLFSIYTLIKTKKWQKIKFWFYKIFLVAILSVSFIFIANNLLFFATSTSQFSLRNIRDRASYQEDEAALASRWSLLPVLVDKIWERPLIGHGFGASLVYQSSDPRVLEKDEEGWYSTYAFEWGYLDIWLKLGVFGLLAYVFLIFTLIYQAFKKRSLYFLAPPLMFLAIVHFFTPYLNHPLGIIIILLSSCILVKDKL